MPAEGSDSTTATLRAMASAIRLSVSLDMVSIPRAWAAAKSDCVPPIFFGRSDRRG
jgi:hypothetical protein